VQAAAKRFRVTGTGKVMARHAGRNHFQEKKGSKRRARLHNAKNVSDTHKNLIRGCLPYGGVV
jgi:large subunit ribosomal protein L35